MPVEVPDEVRARNDDGSLVRNVLVTDDDDDIRATLSDLLEEAGYAVATAVDGEDALAQLRASGRPTVLLLDLMMPKKNGWQVLAELAADPALSERVRVVVLTASSPDRVKKTIGKGVVAVVPKPFSMTAVLDTVRAAARASVETPLAAPPRSCVTARVASEASGAEPPERRNSSTG